MNDERGAGRDTRGRMRFRLGALTAVVATAALLMAACGTSSSTGSTTAISLRNIRKLLGLA